MRSKIYARRFSALHQASALLVLTVVSTACSSDVARFEQQLKTATSMTENQHQIIKRNGLVQQSYPGDVSRDQIKVVKRNVQPALKVSAPRPLVSAVQSSSLAPIATAPAASSVVSQSNVVEKVVAAKKFVSNPVESVKSAAKAKAVEAVTQRVASSNPLVLKPRTTISNPLKLVGKDSLTTGSVAKTVATAAVAQKVSSATKGWSREGGSWVNLKTGETLYNLSRRFGVPVSALMSVNGIKDPNSVVAGSKILVPTYQYGQNVPISAPDSNPVTLASRSTTGFQGQAFGKVTVPKYRVQRSAPVEAPRQILETASTSGSYTVTSGDTLSGIARKHGVSTSALRSANNMSSDIVRLGAKLVIPNGATVASNAVDPVTTSSVPAETQSQKRVVPTVSKRETISAKAQEEVQTAKSTSADAFRWPANGRVIAKFGERTSTGSNDGIDISVPVGTSVKAAENGTVIYSGAELQDFGKLILVSHANGWVSAYAHSSANLVKRGDKVSRGQVIARSGRSGNANVPKLHFELRKNSNPVDPLKHLTR